MSITWTTKATSLTLSIGSNERTDVLSWTVVSDTQSINVDFFQCVNEMVGVESNVWTLDIGSLILVGDDSSTNSVVGNVIRGEFDRHTTSWPWSTT